MKKNLRFLLVMIVSVLTSSLSSFAYDFEVDGIYYNILSAADRTCEVTSGDVEYEGDIVIPSSVVYKNNTVSVISIGDKAFRYCSSLTSIEIPNSVTRIGETAFYGCSSLTSIEIPNSVTRIEYFAFAYCSSFTSIEIPNSVTSIGPSAFYKCSSLTSIEIPNSVTSIGFNAFSACSSLTSIKIPNSVTSIGHEAFSKCTSLSEIKLSENLTRLDYGLFRDCTSLQSLTIPRSIMSIVFYEVPIDGQYVHPTFSSSIKSLRFDYSDEFFKIFYFHSDYADYYSTDWSNKTVSTFTDQIENLYIDREFEKTWGLSFRSLKDLIIGEHISNLQITGDIAPDLATITCYATTPPTHVAFIQSQYTDIIVKVPNSALEAYKNAEGWRNFWNIEGFEYSGIDEVINDNTSKPNETGRYNLNGQAVSEDYKGVVIVRFSDGTTKKIMQ